MMRFNMENWNWPTSMIEQTIAHGNRNQQFTTISHFFLPLHHVLWWTISHWLIPCGNLCSIKLKSINLDIHTNMNSFNDLGLRIEIIYKCSTESYNWAFQTLCMYSDTDYISNRSKIKIVLFSIFLMNI